MVTPLYPRHTYQSHNIGKHDPIGTSIIGMDVVLHHVHTWPYAPIAAMIAWVGGQIKLAQKCLKGPILKSRPSKTLRTTIMPKTRQAHLGMYQIDTPVWIMRPSASVQFAVQTMRVFSACGALRAVVQWDIGGIPHMDLFSALLSPAQHARMNLVRDFLSSLVEDDPDEHREREQSTSPRNADRPLSE